MRSSPRTAHVPVSALAAAAALAAAPAALGGAVTPFQHNAGGWLATVSGESLHAFDEFRPGLAGASTCLGGTPGTSFYLAEGIVTVGTFDDQGAPLCAIQDGSSAPAVSDGWLPGPPQESRFVMQFSPPISAFYTYYGSLNVGERVTMSLYAGGALVAELESDQSFDDVAAAGHGFVSDILVDRIEFTSTDGGGVVVGAFTGLLAGEGSLGTVFIDDYAGPDGEDVAVDFGLVFAPDCNGNGIADDTDIDQGSSTDTNGDGVPDECEYSGVLTGSTVWASGTTVHLEGLLSVEGTLTIEPGAEVLPAPGSRIAVLEGGFLQVNGTAAEPVRMRPLGDDRWDGIVFMGGDGEVLHAELERLGSTGIEIQNASPLIDSCVIRDVASSSGAATGVRVTGVSDPAIVRTVIQSVRGANGTSTGNGGNGGGGGNGANGSGDCDSGNNGAGGSGGGSPANATAAGDAFGVSVGPGSAARIVSCRVTDLIGGNGGHGGNGGNGKSGGDGGNGSGGVFCGGNGGNGGDGGNGGHGADAGRGGHASGVHMVEPGQSLVAQNVIFHLRGGNGGHGGDGGNGGHGGDGGNGAGNLFSPGDGGDGGDGGNAGSGGDGGHGGDAQPVAIFDHTGSVVVSQNSMGGNLTRGSRGLGGDNGSAGGAGSGGSGSPAGSNGSGGSGAGDGANGQFGLAIGIRADAGPSPVILASHNVIVPGNPAYSVGMQAGGNVVIIGDGNCFHDFGAMVQGGVSPGPASIVADPMFVDPDGADDIAGTEDDDRRLADGSPCVNSGIDDDIPADETDLDGDGDFAEPLPFDAVGAARVQAGTVDMGAYESGDATTPCSGDINGDGVVDVDDLVAVITSWGACGECPADVTGDGFVDVDDLVAVIVAWGDCP